MGDDPKIAARWSLANGLFAGDPHRRAEPDDRMNMIDSALATGGRAARDAGTR